ncbi:MAG: hypothetical protein ACERLM_15365, partial [Acidimicrobiales bacterium]
APFLMLPDWLKRTGSSAEVHLLYGEQTGAAVFDPSDRTDPAVRTPIVDGLRLLEELGPLTAAAALTP